MKKLKKINVLFIDDDIVFQQAFIDEIEKRKLHYNCKIADSIFIARKYYKKEKFDIIILDYLLKDGNAFDIIDELKETPIIFITAYGNENVAVKALKNGVDEYVIKTNLENYLELLPIQIENVLKRQNERNNTKRFATIVESSNDAIIGLDINGVITDWNDGAKIIFGFSSDEIINENFSVLLSDELKSEIIDLFSKVINETSLSNYETIFTTKKGKRIPVSLSISPIKDHFNNIIGMSIIARDLTEIKKAEKEILKINSELEKRVYERTIELEETNIKLAKKTNELSYTNLLLEHKSDELEKLNIKLKHEKEKAEHYAKLKSKFISILSHEIRTPLNMILNFLNMTLKGYYDVDENGNKTKLNEKQKYKLQVAYYCSKTLLTLVNDVLDFQKIQAGKIDINKTQFDLKELLDSLSKEIFETYLADKSDRIEYEIVYNKSEFEIYCDKERFIEVIMNLFSNASKYTEKGKISIIVDEAIENDEIMIIVRDTGIGIPEASLESIFEEFEQIQNNFKQKHKSSGLGLPIAKRLIELMDGRIEVKSQINVGSDFIIYLPKRPAENVSLNREKTHKIET